MDIDDGMQQDCPKCDGEIVLDSLTKSTSRKKRVGVRVEDSIVGTGAVEDDEDEDEDEKHNQRSQKKPWKKTAWIWWALFLGPVALSLAIGRDYYVNLQKQRLGIQQKKRQLIPSPVPAPLQQLRNIPTFSTPPSMENVGEVTNSTLDPAVKTPELAIPETFAERNALAKAVAIAFLNAPSLEERSKFVRNAVAIDYDMAHYYKNADPGPIPFREISPKGSESRNFTYTAFLVVFENWEKRMLGLEYTSEGYRVDWPSFVIYSEMDWKKIKTKQPKKPTRMRVMARVSNYYNYGFDVKDYGCYQLSNPIGYERSLYGYVAIDSKAFLMLQRLDNLTNGMEMPLVVEVMYPLFPKADNLVLIERVVSSGWMVRPDTP